MLIAGMDANGGEPHRFALVWMAGDTRKTLVRDITDLRHPLNVCSLDLAAAGYPKSGPIRFATLTTVSVEVADLLYVVDIMTGVWSPLASGTRTAQLDGYDIAPNGLSYAYVLFTNQGRTAEYHLNAGTDALSNDDQILATVQAQSAFSAGDAHVEFAPSGKSVAFAATGVTGTKEGAPVQVWSLDRHLVFSASGTNSVTWAGAGDRLYYDDGTNLRVWIGSGPTSVVLAGRWSKPSASTDRRYVAYFGEASSTIAVIDTVNGAVKRLPGTNTTPSFLTATLLYHRYSLHPQIGLGQARIYDVGDATDVVSVIDHVFGTWPRATPTYGSD